MHTQLYLYTYTYIPIHIHINTLINLYTYTKDVCIQNRITRFRVSVISFLRKSVPIRIQIYAYEY